MRPKTDGLTKKQKLVLDYIKKFQAENKYPPSVRQICSAISLNSPATVHVHINHLVEKGFLKRSNVGNRAIEILVDNEYEDKKSEIRKVPILNPSKDVNILEILDLPKDFFPIPNVLTEEDEEYFTYIMNDDSMSKAGINQNDVVILKRSNVAYDNDIVLAVYDNQINLRRYSKVKREFILKAESTKPNSTRVNRVKIIGQVVGLYRKY